MRLDVLGRDVSARHIADCRKTLDSSLELLIVPGGVYGEHGTIFAADTLIFQSKNRFLAVFAPENLKEFLQKLVGMAVMWERARPSSGFSKTFLTS